MSGAKLQSAGQIRNSYPFLVNVSVKVPIAFTNFTQQGTIALDNIPIPFDSGPDKSARVFLVLNGVYVTVAADVYTPTAPDLTGVLYIQLLDGTRIYLGTLSGSFTDAYAENLDRVIALPLPLSSERVTTVGYFGLDNNGSALGSASAVTATVYANIGLYGEYAEFDMNKLTCDCKKNIQYEY